MNPDFKNSVKLESDMKLVEIGDQSNFEHNDDLQDSIESITPNEYCEQNNKQAENATVPEEASHQDAKSHKTAVGDTELDSVDKELLDRCLNTLKTAPEYRTEHFSEAQEKAVSEGLGIAGFTLAALLFIEFVALSVDGITPRFLLFSLTIIVLTGQGLLAGSPALTLLPNWLDKKHFYQTAEICYRFLYSSLAWASLARQYRIFVGLELANFYLSIGKPAEAMALLERLNLRDHSDDLGLAALIAAMKANCLACLRQNKAALELTEEALDIFENSAIRPNTRKLIEGKFHGYTGAALLHSGQFEAARVQNMRSLEARLKGGSVSRETIGLLAARIGWSYLNIERPIAAERWATLALEATKNSNGSEKARLQALALAGYLKLKASDSNAHQLLQSAGKILRLIKINPKYLFQQMVTPPETLADETLAGGSFTDVQKSSPFGHDSKSKSAKSKLDPNFRYRNTSLKTGLWQLLPFFGIYTLFTLANEGFRASSGIAFMWASYFLALCYGLGLIYLREFLQKKKLKQRTSRLSKVMTTVSFVKADHQGLQTTACMANLGLPFSRTISVKEDFNLLNGNMLFFSKEHEYNVAVENENPLCVETEYGQIELCEEVQTITKASLKQTIRKNLLGLTGLIIVIFYPYTLITSNSEGAPAGLTGYEYYRYGACRLAVSNRYGELKAISQAKEAFKKAAEADQGAIGQLAIRCINSELPTVIPDENVLQAYNKVTDNRCSDSYTRRQLEFCIKEAPRFEWAYSELAEWNIRQKEFAAANKLLNQAAAINPVSLNYLFAKASLQQAQGDRLGAKETLWQALKIDPTYTQTYQRFLSVWLPMRASQ